MILAKSTAAQTARELVLALQQRMVDAQQGVARGAGQPVTFHETAWLRDDGPAIDRRHLRRCPALGHSGQDITQSRELALACEMDDCGAMKFADEAAFTGQFCQHRELEKLEGQLFAAPDLRRSRASTLGDTVRPCRTIAPISISSQLACSSVK